MSNTELDLHANMLAFGSHCYVISYSGRSAIVNTFSDEVGTIYSVPTVDVFVAHDCPITGKTYLLIARKVVYVPSTDHNRIPPFILREAGLEVHDTAMIRVK